MHRCDGLAPWAGYPHFHTDASTVRRRIVLLSLGSRRVEAPSVAKLSASFTLPFAD
jgi:hypothetical protein